MGTKGTSKYNGRWCVGEHIGEWEVVDSAIIISGYAKIRCKCSCGRVERLVDCYSLSVGTSTKCELCGNSMKLDRNPAWKGHGEISGKYIGRVERRANSLGLDHNISPAFLKKLLENQMYKCALSGLDIHVTDGTASLDRIDSKQGYIEGNVQWVHKDINRMKNVYNQDYFISLCRLVFNNSTCTIE